MHTGIQNTIQTCSGLLLVNTDTLAGRNRAYAQTYAVPLVRISCSGNQFPLLPEQVAAGHHFTQKVLEVFINGFL